MLEGIFEGIFDTEATAVISVTDFLLCVTLSLVIGAILAGGYAFRSRYTKSFLTTLALLPAVVCVVIMMVNGNVGTGVAVAGAFSLVRFRSAPGSAREIGSLFVAMGAGLIAGMGYLAFAVLFAVVLCLVSTVYNCLRFGEKQTTLYRTLNITVPEDLDYDGVFEEILAEYADSYELIRVKTTNMGSLFRLTYHMRLKETGREKAMIDSLRCRNGNLEISLSYQETASMEL